MTQNKQTLTPGQNAVLGFLKRRGPLTDTELVALYPADVLSARLMPQSPSGLRTRRRELVTKGYVTTHSTQKSLSNRAQTKWMAK